MRTTGRQHASQFCGTSGMEQLRRPDVHLLQPGARGLAFEDIDVIDGLEVPESAPGLPRSESPLPWVWAVVAVPLAVATWSPHRTFQHGRTGSGGRARLHLDFADGSWLKCVTSVGGGRGKVQRVVAALRPAAVGSPAYPRHPSVPDLDSRYVRKGGRNRRRQLGRRRYTLAHMTSLSERAEALLAAHRPGDPLILVNVWDAWSARVVAEAPGCLAIATASHSIAAAHGYPDGEQIPVAEMIEAIRLIASVVDLPVTADLEAGYGDAGSTVAAAIEAGAVGANLEDQLKPPHEHAQSVAAARAAGDAAGIHFVINARTDEYLLGAKNLDRAISAGRTYLEAGADCIFVPGAGTRDDVAALVAAFDGRLSLIVSSRALPLAELAALGVARLSVGPGSLGMAAAALRDGAAQLLSRGAFPDTLAYRPPGA